MHYMYEYPIIIIIYAFNRMYIGRYIQYGDQIIYREYV